jgi:predicted TPR repeat methyltransferase
MQPKPAHLGQSVASAFQEASVVAAYELRPPYPAETFDVLLALLRDEPRTVLDAGCGTGFLARPLAERVDRVDAVDISAAMTEEGKRLPDGDHPHVRWIVAAIEDAPLDPPYALITAGDSLHWMEWSTVMPRFATLLTPNGWLAILSVVTLPAHWDDELMAIIRRYSTVRDYQRFDLTEELESRGLFTRAGERRTEPVPFTQSLDDYVRSFHGRASFSPERMEPSALVAFDAAVRELVASHAGETITQQVTAHIVWGRPHG